MGHAARQRSEDGKPTMLTTTQAAQRLGLSRSSVLALIAQGKLPAQKIGRDWMIDESDLELVKVRRPVGYPAGRPRKGPQS